MSVATHALLRRDAALATAGVVFGIGVGAFAARWWLRRRRTVASEEEQRQMELLRRLAEHTGNSDFDPALHPLPQIVQQVQLVLDVDPPDGRWSAETERAVLSVLGSTDVAPAEPEPNPQHELEPDANWEETYQAGFGDAFDLCCEEDSVVSFDQAVTSLLQYVFPDKGSFRLAPHTGVWKRAARERCRHDLAARVGYTEVEARAVLVSSVGRRALAEGADFGQAVRVMAAHAWPTARWDAPLRSSWQQAFCEAASAAIQPA